jgi:hypothetical protein
MNKNENNSLEAPYKRTRIIDEDKFRCLILNSTSRRQVLLGMGWPDKGSTGYRLFNYFIALHKIDVSHLVFRDLSPARLAQKYLYLIF